jgi:hypothetical protein
VSATGEIVEREREREREREKMSYNNQHERHRCLTWSACQIAVVAAERMVVVCGHSGGAEEYLSIIVI